MVNFIEAKPLVALDGLRLDDEVTPTLTLSLSSIHPGLDGCVLDGVLTAKECAHVVATAERAGFSFWASDGPSEENRRMRNADTLEFVGTDLCAQLWARIAPFVTARSAISTDQARSERDLEGEWAAAGLNEHLLINKYAAGGHFAPHADGSTIETFNRRSLYTVLLYLNDCAAGGATQILHGEQCESTESNAQGAAVARDEAVAYAVQPVAGRVLVYWHQTTHAGETVGPGALKYCVRSDVMFERDPPRLTAPNDLRAFELYQQAREMEAAGQPMEAMMLFRQASKASPGIKEAYRL